MRKAWQISRRVLPAVVAIGLIAALAAACGSGNSTSGTATGASPTIEFQTPAGSASASGTTPAGSSSTASAGGSSTAGAGGAATTLQIAAEPGDKYDKNTLTVPAGAPVTVQFTNNDSIIHNFAVYDTKGGKELYTGDLFKGPNVTKDEKFTAPAKAGNYYFQCDVHPDQMNGTLVVQ